MARKRKFKPKPRFWALFFCGLLAAYGWAYATQARELERGAAAIATLEEKKARQEDAIAEMRRKIRFAATDEFVERQAHATQGTVKEGEICYVAAAD